MTIRLFGHYGVRTRIDSFGAAGGMGQVYRATDTRLIRTVAIKICAGPFSERSAQEAKLIAMRRRNVRKPDLLETSGLTARAGAARNTTLRR